MGSFGLVLSLEECPVIETGNDTRARINRQHRDRDRRYADQAEQRKWALFLIRETTELRTDQILEKYIPQMTLSSRSLPPSGPKVRKPLATSAIQP